MPPSQYHFSIIRFEEEITYVATPSSIAEQLPGRGLKLSQVYKSSSLSLKLLFPLTEYVVPFVAKSESKLPESELMIGSFRPGILIFDCGLAP